MPRWGSKLTSKLKGKQTDRDAQSSAHKNQGDAAAVMMASELNHEGGTGPINLIRSETSESTVDMKAGRYNVEDNPDGADVETGNDQNTSNEKLGVNQSNKNSETVPSEKLKQYWSRKREDADSVSKVTAKVDDKYLLIEDDGKRHGKYGRSDDRSTGKKSYFDEMTLSTFSSFAGRSARRFGFGRSYHRREDDETLRSYSYSMDDTFDYRTVEVKQKYGYCSIGLSIIQLFILAVMMALCGVAPLEVNPMVGPYPDTFSYWGGKNPYLITQQFEIWRVATPVFLHVGIIHLFCNVAIQLETGAYFEREWGSGIWFLIYILSAIGSTIVSCISQPDTISVGASGALMGLFGAKLGEVFMFSCFCVEHIDRKSTHGMRMEQLSGALCSVAILSLFSLIPYVDWAGHLGGLGVGFLVGLCIFSANIDGVFIKCLWGTFGIVSLIGGLAYAVFYIYTEMQFDNQLLNVCNYYRQLYREGYECQCQNTFGAQDAFYIDDDDWGD